MKKIPTLKEIETNFQLRKIAGLTTFALSPLERIIVNYRPNAALAAIMFRYRLKGVLNEGKKFPSSDKKLLAFATRYFSGADKEFSRLMLASAVLEWNDKK